MVEFCKRLERDGDLSRSFNPAHLWRTSIASLAVLCVLAITSSLTIAIPVASASSPLPTGQITLFPGVGGDRSIVTGPDGNLWFTKGDSIVRMTTEGSASSFTGPGISQPKTLTVGPDGSLWFTNYGNNSIGRVTLAGLVTNFPSPDITSPWDIAAGADGNLWFTNTGDPQTGGSSIGRMTTAGQVTLFKGEGVKPQGIAGGPDGNLWFTNTGDDFTQQGYSIGRITPSGAISLFRDLQMYHPAVIRNGVDGTLRFTTALGAIGRITTSGVIDYVGGNPAGNNALDLAAGPDGNMWLTGGNAVVRLGPNGPTQFGGYDVSPIGLTTGSDGNIWFTNGGSVGRLTPGGVSAPDPPVNVTAVAGVEEAQVSWSPPPYDGAAPIVGYQVGSDPVGGSCVWRSGPLTCTVTGLTAGVAYRFSVNAENSMGGGLPSALSNEVIPTPDTATIPGPPIGVTAVAGNAVANISWSPPVIAPENVTSYVATASPGGATCTWLSGPLSCQVQNLTNGTTYTFTVRAKHKTVAGDPSSPSNAVVPATVPGAPTGVTGVSGDGQVTVKWSAPPSNGGSAIIGYTATATPGGSSCTWVAGPLQCVVPGLANGTSYTFTVRATNALGMGSPSDASPPVIPATVPGAPTNVVATPANTAAAVTWSAPATGGAPITSYVVTASPGGATCTWAGGPLACTISQLLNGTPYTFTVRAKNSAGVSPDSAPSTAVVPATVPGAPTGVLGAPLDSSVMLTWVAPSSNGGSPITGYTATASPGGATCHWSTGPLSCVVPGLVNGSSYTFSVKASNMAGAGPSSAPSSAVVPVAVPGAPVNVVAVAGKESASVSWSAPSSNGGVAISQYVVTAMPGAATCSTSGLTSCVFTGLIAGTPYTFTVQAKNSVGMGVASAASNPATPWDGAGYHPVTPSRILDSRGQTGGWNAPLASGVPLDLQVTGLGGSSNVPSNATAVVLNVTATAANSPSFLTIYPSGLSTPNASNLNFGAGETIANLVTVKLGTAGLVRFANAAGSVEVIADVVGYYDDGTVPGDLYTGITPSRLLDSRTATGGWNATLTAGAPRDLVVRQPGNAAGVPATATAVIANITVTGGSAGSFLSVWPSGLAKPNVSNLNFAAGQTIPNLAIIKVGDNGAIRFANAVGGVDVIVDIVGYFDPTTGSRFHAIDPTRVLDDRVSKGLAGAWSADQTRALPVAGVVGTNVPVGATGLVANFTATSGTAGSFLTVYPDGVTRPNSSNLNFGAGQTIPNLVAVKIGANGNVNIYNKLGKVDVIADAVGYYSMS